MAKPPPSELTLTGKVYGYGIGIPRYAKAGDCALKLGPNGTPYVDITVFGVDRWHDFEYLGRSQRHVPNDANPAPVMQKLKAALERNSGSVVQYGKLPGKNRSAYTVKPTTYAESMHNRRWTPWQPWPSKMPTTR